MSRPRQSRTAGFLGAAMLGSGGLASAQELLLEVRGTRDTAFFGYSARSVGDTNGDGLPDLLVGAPQADGGGAALLFSGADGQILGRFVSDDASLLGTSLTGLGDVDQDGRADFAIGAPGSFAGGSFNGGVEVRSGRDGSVLYHISGLDGQLLGTSVDDTGDVDGDGIHDLLVGAPGGALGTVQVHSGVDGRRIVEIRGRYGFGDAVTRAGDIDQDGHADFAASQPYADNPDGGVGLVHVYSGATGARLRSYSSPFHEQYGRSVSEAGDVDADGVEDLVIGGPALDLRTESYRGRVEVRSGFDGTVLFSAEGDRDGDELGWSVASAGDVNGDGHADVIAGAAQSRNGTNRHGYVRLFSGATGAVLYDFEYGPNDGQAGFCVAPFGDLDGDGFDDLLTTEPFTEGGARIGVARVHAGRALYLQAKSSVIVGETITLKVREGPRSGPLVMMVTQVDGQDRSIALDFARFDALGGYDLQATVLPGLSGLSFGLRCFACEDPDAHRGVISTVQEVVTIR